MSPALFARRLTQILLRMVRRACVRLDGTTSDVGSWGDTVRVTHGFSEMSPFMRVQVEEHLVRQRPIGPPTISSWARRLVTCCLTTSATSSAAIPVCTAWLSPAHRCGWLRLPSAEGALTHHHNAKGASNGPDS